MAELNHILFLYQILLLFYLSNAVLRASDVTVLIVHTDTHFTVSLADYLFAKKTWECFGLIFTVSYSTYPHSKDCRGTSPACLPAVRSGAFCALLVLIVKGLWSSSGQFGSVLETGSHTKATAVISVVVGRLVLIILFACELHV